MRSLRVPRVVVISSLLVLLFIGSGLAFEVLMHAQNRRADEMVRRIQDDLTINHALYVGAVDWVVQNRDREVEFDEVKLPAKYASVSNDGAAQYERRGTADAPAYAVSFVAKYTDGVLLLTYTTEPSPQRERWFKSWATWTEEMAPGWYLVSEQ